MGKTKRWWNKPHNRFRMDLDKGTKCPFCDDYAHRCLIPLWKERNPLNYKHERKILRVKLHRKTRVKNKNLIRKGWDYEVESKTNGWLSH